MNANNKKPNYSTERFQSFNIVVFGGDGDLAIRKIYPALFHRDLDGQINIDYNIVGITRKDPDEKEFFDKLIPCLETSEHHRYNRNEIEKFIQNNFNYFLRKLLIGFIVRFWNRWFVIFLKNYLVIYITRWLCNTIISKIV